MTLIPYHKNVNKMIKSAGDFWQLQYQPLTLNKQSTDLKGVGMHNKKQNGLEKHT